MNRQAQRGVALVITLVMLAVVTFMAITFLAVSRRDRAAVSVVAEQTDAQMMADAALARAQSGAVARMLTLASPMAYDLMVSTNYFNPAGLDPNSFSYTNVNYGYTKGGALLRASDQLLNLANLQLDPRPPVYVRTNSDLRLPLDFRFYLDLNRNGRFETNGWQPVYLNNGFVYRTNGVPVLDYFVGDPEWIGVLQHPDRPHAPDNRFIGRYAFVAVPVGKTLDWNFIHNNSRRSNLDQAEPGFYRHQGYGSWELNLAGFLRDLNTNVWRTYFYDALDLDPTRPLRPSEAFRDALGFLSYRYATNQTLLDPVERLFGAAGAYAFRVDGIDGYADGPRDGGYPDYAPVQPLPFKDNDNPKRPWPGSENARAYLEPQELFDGLKVPNYGVPPLLTRLANVQSLPSTYDRFTYYRMLAQIGMDSAPANHDRINLNYDNISPTKRLAANATNFLAWQPAVFLANAAQRLLQAARFTNIVVDPARNRYTNYWVGDTRVRPAFSLTNILVYGGWVTNLDISPNGGIFTNIQLQTEYTPAVHRLLQLAANIYDATTNRTVGANSYPSVFRPTFAVFRDARGVDNVIITGFKEVLDTAFLNQPFRDLNNPADRAALASRPDDNVWGVGLIIGAKKGLPNFNEFALQNVAQVTRKLELRKINAADLRPALTNQMYLLCISNQFGLEFWNSYTNDFNRRVRYRVVGDFIQTLTNRVQTASGSGFSVNPWLTHYIRDGAVSRWPAQRFLGVFTNSYTTNVNFLPDSILRVGASPSYTPATTNAVFQSGDGFYIPQWSLVLSNRCYAVLIDESVSPNRVLDYVSYANMTTTLDITGAALGQQAALAGGVPGGEPPNVWLTNRVSNSTSIQAPTMGVINQLRIADGEVPISDQQWASYSRVPADGLDKSKSIDHLRVFMGLSPLVYNDPASLRRIQSNLAGKVAYQAGFSPTRKIYQTISWQANDPLVHYLTEDMLDPFNRPSDPYRTNAVRFAVPPQIPISNTFNLGFVNDRYRPWGGNPYKTADALAYEPSVKDPLIRSSDDWSFPTNKFPNLGWLGRVHRGTPWQTVYLKAAMVNTNLWLGWAGSQGTHPTNDWGLLDVFTVAPNDNAARGLLSVNQTNLAAWSAVLSGVSVLTNTTPRLGAATNQGVGTLELAIQPAAQSPQLRQIVEGIIRTRSRQTNGYFNTLGSILATPELSSASPFINTNHLYNDVIMERIPQEVLSLLKADEPRFVVYAFGQALREAPGSIYLGVGRFNKMCTNYQVRAESAVRAVIRLDGPIINPRAVVESYTVLPGE